MRDALKLADIQNSFELLVFLKTHGYLNASYTGNLELWWPDAGSFAVVIGAVLVQNSQWNKVTKALYNLDTHHLLQPHKIANMPVDSLQSLIAPAGLYRKKAVVLKNLCANIVRDFDSFANMQQECSRQWLLMQKGIGQETADCILCYAFLREEMVADSYSQRILKFLGYEFERYEEIKEWLKHGIYENIHRLCSIYERNVSMNYVFARFHGKIDEFVKENKI